MSSGLHRSIRLSCPILMKLESSLQVLEIYSNIKFHKNPSSGSRVVACGQTDEHITNLILAFRNFANRLKNDTDAVVY